MPQRVPGSNLNAASSLTLLSTVINHYTFFPCISTAIGEMIEPFDLSVFCIFEITDD